MPSRPSLSGKEDNSRRASLRRLSSLASLNPFNRRRQPSEDVEHPHQIQTPSVPPMPPVPRLPYGETYSMSAFFEPTVEMYGNKRQSYLSLQDDPIHLPKSRTFSNLPVPATTKARPRPTLPSLSKSQSTAYLPSSRIPTPVGGLRQTSRLATTSKSVAKPNKPKSMVRSDTEPLLSSSVPKPQRSTVFKENLSLSPIKPLSRLELFHPDTEELIPKKLQPSRNLADAQHDTSSRSPVRPRHLSERQRVLPSMSMSTSAPSKRLSYGSEIKQQRLLSARYPPTPPLPKTPLAASMPPTSHAYHRLKSSNKLSHKHKEHALSPCNERSIPATFPPAPDTISTTEPIAYWCGRFSALNDRFRSDRLRNDPDYRDSYLESPEELASRTKKVMVHLHSLCVTPEARRSFMAFQEHFARATGACGVAGDEAYVPWVDTSISSEPESLRKISFIERLMGRSRKSLA